MQFCVGDFLVAVIDIIHNLYGHVGAAMHIPLGLNLQFLNCILSAGCVLIITLWFFGWQIRRWIVGAGGVIGISRSSTGHHRCTGLSNE